MTTTEPTLQIRHDHPSLRPTLEEAQQYVGGLVEIAPVLNSEYRDAQLLVNEEGLVHDLPPNVLASIFAGYEIRGNAMILLGDARWD